MNYFMIIKVGEVDEIIISLLFHCCNANIYYLEKSLRYRQNLILVKFQSIKMAVRWVSPMKTNK